MKLTRRRVLVWPVVLAASSRLTSLVAAQGLEQFATGGPPCDVNATPTPAAGKDPAFRAGAPERSALVEAGAAAGVPLTFAGTISGIRCGRIAGARVDVWHADPAGAFNPKTMAFRGYQLTDSLGAFQFRTVMPGASPTRPAYLGLNVKVAGKTDFWTVLFFPDDSRNASDRRFRPELVVKLVPDGRTRRAHFDVLLDL